MMAQFFERPSSDPSWFRPDELWCKLGSASLARTILQMRRRETPKLASEGPACRGILSIELAQNIGQITRFALRSGFACAAPLRAAKKSFPNRRKWMAKYSVFLRAGFALSLALVAIGGAGLRAQSFHATETRGPVRRVDLSPMKGEVSSEILAGPNSGLDSAWIVYTRMAAGVR